ncbi:unnamed protein product, partial [marine sediment metagenome]
MRKASRIYKRKSRSNLETFIILIGAIIILGVAFNLARDRSYIDCGVVPENFTSIIKKNRPDLVVLIDAVEMDLKSGEFRTISPDRISALHLTTHSMPLSFLISYLKEYTQKLIFI